MTLSPRADSILGSLTRDEKIGQLFVFTFVSLRQALHDLAHFPGGYVRIYSDALTVAKQTRILQERSRIPLVISADFERGIGGTISGGIDLGGNMCIGASGREDIAYETGRIISTEARAMGVNKNYVPVVDVNVNEDNPIINTRAFGANAADVARLGAAFIRGSKAGGVLTCAKHFPGHGDTATDSHTTLGTITVSRERLDEIELVPFRAAIEAGVDSIMSAHLAVPALDSSGLPGTLSPLIMTDLLRGELGFQGVAVSDALEMGGIARHFTPEEAIIRAINAGIDQLIMPVDNARAVRIVRDALASGDITEARLDEAVGRILTMKDCGGILDAPLPDLASLPEALNTAAHYEFAVDAALAGITLIKGAPAEAVLPASSRLAVITVSNHDDGRSYFLEPKTFGDHCRSHFAGVSVVHAGRFREESVHEFGVAERALEVARAADAIVVAAYVRVVINSGAVSLDPGILKFLNEAAALGKPLIVVSFGSPYVIKQVPSLPVFVCTYGASESSQEAAAMLLAGRATYRGRLPVTLTY